MDRELRIKFVAISCFAFMFCGLVLFMAVLGKDLISPANLPVTYAIIALSGLANMVSVLVSEKVIPVMIVSFFMGLGMIVFALIQLAPH